MNKRNPFTEVLGVFNILGLLMAMVWSLFDFGAQPGSRPALWEIIGAMGLMSLPYIFGALTAWSVLDEDTWGLRLHILINVLFAVASIDPVMHVLNTGNFQTNEPAFLVFGGPICILNCILMMHRVSNIKS